MFKCPTYYFFFFSSKQFLAKVNYLPKTCTSIYMKDSTLPVQIAHPSKARFPNPIGHWQRSNDRGLPRGKEGGQF